MRRDQLGRAVLRVVNRMAIALGAQPLAVRPFVARVVAQSRFLAAIEARLAQVVLRCINPFEAWLRGVSERSGSKLMQAVHRPVFQASFKITLFTLKLYERRLKRNGFYGAGQGG